MILHDSLVLGLLSLLLNGLLIYAAAQDRVMLAIGITVAIVLGPWMTEPITLMPGLTFNTETIFISTAIFGLGLKLQGYGQSIAFTVARHMLFAAVMLFLSLFVLSSIHLLKAAFEVPIRLAGIRYASLYMAECLFVVWLQRPSCLPPLIRIPAVSIAIHAFDAALFFTASQISNTPIVDIASLAATSVLSRAVFTVLEIPLLAAFLWMQRNGRAPSGVAGEGRAA